MPQAHEVFPLAPDLVPSAPDRRSEYHNPSLGGYEEGTEEARLRRSSGSPLACEAEACSLTGGMMA